jgi:hypothetical protein
MRKGAIILGLLLAAALPTAVAFAISRPPAGRYSGEGGSITVTKNRRDASAINFMAEVSPESADCTEATPSLGKVKVSVHGSFPITLDKANGYQVWISGHPSSKAYHQVAPMPATFGFGAAGPSAKGKLDLIWTFGNVKGVELYAEVDGCTWYILSFSHR